MPSSIWCLIYSPMITERGEENEPDVSFLKYADVFNIFPLALSFHPRPCVCNQLSLFFDSIDLWINLFANKYFIRRIWERKWHLCTNTTVQTYWHWLDELMRRIGIQSACTTWENLWKIRMRHIPRYEKLWKLNRLTGDRSIAILRKSSLLKMRLLLFFACYSLGREKSIWFEYFDSAIVRISNCHKTSVLSVDFILNVVRCGFTDFTVNSLRYTKRTFIVSHTKTHTHTHTIHNKPENDNEFFSFRKPFQTDHIECYAHTH